MDVMFEGTRRTLPRFSRRIVSLVVWMSEARMDRHQRRAVADERRMPTLEEHVTRRHSSRIRGAAILGTSTVDVRIAEEQILVLKRAMSFQHTKGL